MALDARLNGGRVNLKSTDSLYIVVPVLNEAQNLQRLIKSFHDSKSVLSDRYHVKFLLIDDGSTDGTAEIVKQLGQGLDFEVLTHARNMGPGFAFGTAFEYLANRITDNDWVVTMEGDNTSRQEILNQMMTRTREGYDVILASPYMYGGGLVHTTPLRILLSHVANLFIKEALGIHGIMTMSSFYRLYRGRIIKTLQSRHGNRITERCGFESMIELLLKLIYAGATISEVPMVLDTSRRAGKSKMKVAKTIFGYFTLWLDKSRWRKESIARLSQEPLSEV